MKSNNILFDMTPNADFSNIIEDIKHLSNAERQKVLKLITEISNTETIDSDTEPICYCLRCGKPLKKSNSIYHSMGPTCYKRHCEELKKRTKALF